MGRCFARSFQLAETGIMEHGADQVLPLTEPSHLGTCHMPEVIDADSLLAADDKLSLFLSLLSPELPRPLAHLCRLRVRKAVGKYRLKLLDTLPLPGRMIRYLKHENTQ